MPAEAKRTSVPLAATSVSTRPVIRRRLSLDHSSCVTPLTKKRFPTNLVSRTYSPRQVHAPHGRTSQPPRIHRPASRACSWPLCRVPGQGRVHLPETKPGFGVRRAVGQWRARLWMKGRGSDEFTAHFNRKSVDPSPLLPKDGERDIAATLRSVP